jgi:hypothetical protein
MVTIHKTIKENVVTRKWKVIEIFNLKKKVKKKNKFYIICYPSGT